MADTEVLRFEADTERGEILLTDGRAFLGGVYDVQLIVDKHEGDENYALALFAYENQAKPLYIGKVTGSGTGRISFSQRELIECYRPQARVWNASIPVYAYLYRPLEASEAEQKAAGELPISEEAVNPVYIIATGRIDLLWTPIFGEAKDKTPVTAVGPTGPQGMQGEKGEDGVIYTPEYRYVLADDGVTVKEVYVDFVPNVEGLAKIEGLIQLKGANGRAGVDGKDGRNGVDGKSSYEIAQEAGFAGTQEDWVDLISGLPTELRVTRQSIADTQAAQKALAEGLRENARIVSTGVNKVNGAIEAIVKTAETAKGEIAESVTLADYYAEKARVYAEGGMMPSLGGVQLPAMMMGASGYWEKTKQLKEQVDAKVTEANDAKDDAVKAKGEAEGFKKDAEGFRNEAQTSASNASTSATQAKTSETNAKASAVQAENATALKVDQRLVQSDNSPYPLVVRVDKDVYKLVAPQDTSNSWHYCCDGMAHYFAQYPSKLYVYDGNLKFTEALQVDYGQMITQAETYLNDFCTKIGENYFIRWNGHPYSTHKIRKYDKSGAFVKEVVVDGIGAYNQTARVCRNERTNHLLVFSSYADGVGYKIYDEDLIFLGEKKINAQTSRKETYWLRHLNVAGGFTLVSFAPTDATKTALFILDENDDIQEVDVATIRGSGVFTSEDLTATGRTSAEYFVPRMFYSCRSIYDGSGGGKNHHHIIEVTNGAKWYRINFDFNADALGEDLVTSGGINAITNASLPQAKYDEKTLFFANGNGSNTGESSYSQPIVALTSGGILTKVADLYNVRYGFTDFAPDPFASIASFPRRITGNTRLANNDVATSRAYNLYPANDGAVMFTP